MQNSIAEILKEARVAGHVRCLQKRMNAKINSQIL